MRDKNLHRFYLLVPHRSVMTFQGQQDCDSLFDLLGPFDWERAQMYVDAGLVRVKPAPPMTTRPPPQLWDRQKDHVLPTTTTTMMMTMMMMGPSSSVEEAGEGGFIRRVKPKYVDGMYRKMVSEPSGSRKFSRNPK